jgi:hypothetical protein
MEKETHANPTSGILNVYDPCPPSSRGVSLSPDGRTDADRAYLHLLRVSRLVQDMESALKEFDVWLGLLQCLVFLVLVLDGPVCSGDEQAFFESRFLCQKGGGFSTHKSDPACLN